MTIKELYEAAVKHEIEDFELCTELQKQPNGDIRFGIGENPIDGFSLNYKNKRIIFN